MAIYQKHPRTYHLEFSQGVQSDDKILKDTSFLVGKRVVATAKMDGENTNIYKNYTHARSIDSKHNFTRDWIKKMHGVLKHDIPDNIALVGENLWAEHAIRYPDGYLSGYFYLFAVLEDGNTYLSYDDVCMYAQVLDLPTPKVLYDDIFDEKNLKALSESLDTSLCEGFVVRVADSFAREDYSKAVAKYVRPNHVQVDAEHWLKHAKQNGELQKPAKPYYMN